MALEQNNEQQYREVVDKYHDPVAYYQMTTRDYVLRPDSEDLLGEITITLPPVAEAKGRFYSIFAKYADMENPVWIVDKGDSENWEGRIELYATGQGCLLYSDGIRWCLRTFADIETGSSPRGSYTQAAGISGEITAGRFRAEGCKVDTGSAPTATGVHAQGIAYASEFAAVINAAYCEAIAKDGSSVETIMRGLMVAADSEGTPTLIQSMYGAHIRVKTSVQPAGAYRCLVLEHEEFGGHRLLDEYIKILDTTFNAGDVTATYGLRMLTVGTITNGIAIDSPVVNGMTILGTDTITNLGISLTGVFDVAGIQVGLDGTPLVAQAGAPMFESWVDTGLAAGTYNANEMHLVQSAAIQTGYVKTLRVHATSNVKTGGSFNAVYAKLDYQTDGYPWGDCAPVSSELVMPNNAAIPRGLFTCAELQIIGGAASAFGGGGPLSFLHCKASGTKAFVEDEAYLIDLDDMVIGDDHIVRTNTTTSTHGIRILIDGVRYDILCSAAHA